jgi:hypothetical protein
MMILFIFLVLSIFFLLVFAVVTSKMIREAYTLKVEKKLLSLGCTLIHMESSNPFDLKGEPKEVFVFVPDFGSSFFFRLYKKIKFINPKNETVSGWVIIKLLLFFITSIEIFDDLERPMK